MIVDERMLTYVRSLCNEPSDRLLELERQALEDNVPVIRKEMQDLLRFLLILKKPVKILEVGTAIGFSALLMSEYCPEAKITTIEKYEKRIPVAKENFNKFDKGRKITLLEGDALEIMEDLDECYDFIFMDAAKGQYINFLPHVMRLLAKNGLLVSDNVRQDGEIVESRFAVTRRNRTIHSRMREYLYELNHREDIVTTVLPVADGVTLSVKK